LSLRTPKCPHFQVLNMLPQTNDIKNAVEFSFIPTKNGAPYYGIRM
jgi:hypothetical protein